MKYGKLVVYNEGENCYSSYLGTLEAIVAHVDESHLEFDAEDGDVFKTGDGFAVLKILDATGDYKKLSTQYDGNGNFIRLYPDTDVYTLLDTDMEISELDELMEEHKKINDVPFEATLREFSTEPNVYDTGYISYDIVKETSIDLPPEIKTLDEAELYILKNYPEGYFGCSINKHCLNPCFAAIAVPQHYEREFGTNDRKLILSVIREQVEERVNKMNESQLEEQEDLEY